MDGRLSVTTKRGESYFSSLGRSGTFKNAPTGKYECGIILKGEALEDFKAKVEEFLNDTYGPKKAKTAKLPFRQTKDGDTVVKFTTKVEINGKKRVLPVWDKLGRPVTQEQSNQVGNGSVIAVTGTMAMMQKDVGVSLFLDSVQVFKLVKYVPGAHRPEAAEDADELGGDEFDADDGETGSTATSGDGEETAGTKTPDF